MMNRLYLDNAATSFPKPPQVTQAMVDFATTCGASPGRGAYAESRAAGQALEYCRHCINDLMNGESPDHVIFTLNTTDALNLAIYGIVEHVITSSPGARPHIITTEMDHNSVLRPLHDLADRKRVNVTYVPCDPQTGLVDPKHIESAQRPETALVAVVHGSNVTGTVQDVAAIGAICRRKRIPFLVDAAQTMGHQPLDVQAMDIDLLAFPGHKGLLGPLGTGGLYIRPGLESQIAPLRRGGTGSRSEEPRQPTSMPDRYECGSHNTVGLIGLTEGVKWILKQTPQVLWYRERALIEQLLEGLHAIEAVRILGPQSLDNRCGVISIQVAEQSPMQVATALEQDHGVLTRAGLHCAPFAHQALGSAEDLGATRLSLGPFVEAEDIARVLDAIANVARPLPVTISV